MLRKSRNKIHCDLLKGESAFFCSDAVEWYFSFMSQDLVLLADRASLYVVRYPLVHPRPWQDFSCFPDRLVSSGVSCRGMVVDEGHEVSFGGVWELCRVGGVDEEFWFKESLIFI